ncbi:MAG: GatB/YqeY domain-containing protein [Chitinophagales bacterium]
MNLEEKIMNDLKEAMKNKNEGMLRGIRAIKSAIIVAKTEPGATRELNQEQELKILQKLMKQRKDSLEIYERENREDLAGKEREEIAVIEKYLPQQMNADELIQVLSKIIADTGAATPQDMGKVMSAATRQLAGRADGKSISAMVRELLSNS